MDKNQSLRVSVNGKKTKAYKDQMNRSHYNQTKDLYENYKLPSNQDEYTEFSTPSKKRDKNPLNTSFYHVKPLLISIISAIAIGSLLGVLMLVMFKGFGNQPATAIPDVTNHEENNDEDHENEKVSVNVPAINAYVLQAGVFSQMENAEHWAKSYEEAGFPTMIWERDNQFFLLAGITTTRAKGKVGAENFIELDIDIFVKEWQTVAKEWQLNEVEQQWIETFHTIWKETLQAISEENIILMEQWEDLLEQASQISTFQAFETEVKTLLQSESINNPRQQQQLLLVALYQFEKILLQQ